ncbi:MAG: hypothetical protein U9R79_04465 [Armatimonadota bacterium]|nr:hypothetical protein [Armatimonadota bacterium]
MKHFLRPIPIGSEQVDRLEDIARRCLEAARVQADDGTWIVTPAGSGKYSGMYTRDFCYTVEGCGHLMDPAETAAAIDYLFERQRRDGLMPNRVEADGRAIYVVNESTEALNHQPTDNAQFAVKLVDAYIDHTSDYELFTRHKNALMDAMERVSLTEDGLVWIDPAHPSPAYGFTDTVAKTGEVLFSSLLYWEACMLLAKMCQRVEHHDGAHVWFEAAEHTNRVLREFYDEPSGMMVAARVDCEQMDVWGSCYAGVIRALSKSETARIGEWLFDRYEDCFLRGCVRHLPAPEYWQKMLVEYQPGRYQNGGYWPTATGWAAMVLDRYDRDTAVMLVEDCIELMAEADAPEWISETASDGLLYVASAANVLGAVKRP